MKYCHCKQHHSLSTSFKYVMETTHILCWLLFFGSTPTKKILQKAYTQSHLPFRSTVAGISSRPTDYRFLQHVANDANETFLSNPDKIKMRMNDNIQNLCWVCIHNNKTNARRPHAFRSFSMLYTFRSGLRQSQNVE